MENKNLNWQSNNPKKLEDIKTIYVSVEGEKTEIQYFSILNHIIKFELERDDIVLVPICSEKGCSAPPHVLKRMETELSDKKLQPLDEAWLVIDRDRWPESQLDELQCWADKCRKYHFALSNPFLNIGFYFILKMEKTLHQRINVEAA